MVEQIAGAESRVLAVQAGIAVSEDVENLAQRTVAEFGRLDVMVNNVKPFP